MPAPVFTAPPQTLSGAVGTPVSVLITTTGSPATYTASGRLPPGVTLPNQSAILQGTPTTPGVYVATLTAYDGTNTTNYQIAWTITGNAVVPPTPDATVTKQTSYIADITAFLDAYKVAPRTDCAAQIHRIRNQAFAFAQAKSISYDATPAANRDDAQGNAIAQVEAILAAYSPVPDGLSVIHSIWLEIRALNKILQLVA